MNEYINENLFQILIQGFGVTIISSIIVRLLFSNKDKNTTNSINLNKSTNIGDLIIGGNKTENNITNYPNGTDGKITTEEAKNGTTRRGEYNPITETTRVI